MRGLIRDVKKDHSYDLKDILQLPSQVKLDKSQAACFLAGLRQRVALIQGPPGAGKSFIGSLITKAILKYTNEKILVVCYTHHALDQFLEDLLNLDIPESDMVRMGSMKKAPARTQALSLNQTRSSVALTREQHDMVRQWKSSITAARDTLRDAFASFQGTDFSKSKIMEHIEFLSDGPPFFDAFQVPEGDDGISRVGRKGWAADRFYLLDRWCRGKDAGVFQKQHGDMASVSARMWVPVWH